MHYFYYWLLQSIHSMIQRVIQTCRMIRIISHKFANLKVKNDLFNSQFHLNGHRHFQRSKQLTLNPTNNLLEIQKATLNLQKIRMLVQKVKDSTLRHNLTEEEGEWHKNYLDSYLKLIEAIKESKLNEQWFYQMAGWYNIQSVFPNLVEKLFGQGLKKRHLALVEALSWMRPHIYKMPPNLQLYEIQRYNKNIDAYYKSLNNSLPLPNVRQIENIFEQMQTPNKARFYQRFVHINIANILKHIDKQKKEQIQDVLWLYKIYVGNYNDKQEIIQQFDHFFAQLQPSSDSLSEKDLLTLMQIYSSKGRLNKKVYEKHLKNFIVPKKDSSVNFVAKSLSFLLHSEAQDPQAIKLLMKFISRTLQDYKISPQIMLQIHFLCHYMSIKGIHFDLHKSTIKQLHECCRKHEGNGSTARVVAIALDDKARKQGKSYYESDCLRKQRQASTIKEDIGSQIKLVADYKKYKNVRICTIDIADCVIHDQTKEVIVLENLYNRFEHSKRLSRYFQVREAILSHYGVKVNYLQKKESFKRMPKEENIDYFV